MLLVWGETSSSEYLVEQLRGGVRRQDGRGHVWAHSVQLLDLSLPHLQEPRPSSVHPLPARPLTLQVEGEARLLPLSPGTPREQTGEKKVNAWSDSKWARWSCWCCCCCSLTWRGPPQLLWLSWQCGRRSPSRWTRSGARRRCEAGDAPLPVMENGNFCQSQRNDKSKGHFQKKLH